MRLSVLGELQVDPGPTPQNVRAQIVLLLLGLKVMYTRQELVDILWPGDEIDDQEPVRRKSVNDNLDQTLGKARKALGPAGPRLRSRNRIVRLERGVDPRTNTSLTTDIDDFYADASSPDPARNLRALKSIGGRVGEGIHLPAAELRWIDDERARQRKMLAALVRRLFPAEESVEAAVDELLARGVDPLLARHGGAPPSVGIDDEEPGDAPGRPSNRSRERADTPAKQPVDVRVASSPQAYRDAIVEAEQHATTIDRIPKRISVVFKDQATVEAIASQRFGPGSGSIGHYVDEHVQRRDQFQHALGNGMICREIYNKSDLVRYVKRRSHGAITLEPALMRATIVRWREAIETESNYYVGLTEDPIPFKYAILDREMVVLHEAIGVADRQRLNAVFIKGSSAVSGFSEDFDIIWERIDPPLRDRTNVVRWIDETLVPLVGDDLA